MADALANFAYSTVAAAPSPATSGTSLDVASGDDVLFPAAPFNATVWPAGARPTIDNAEIVRVTAKSDETFTIVREQESTTARSIVVGDQIAQLVTRKMLNDLTSATVTIPVTNYTEAVTTGDGKAYFPVPAKLNGYNLIAAAAHVLTVSSSGTPTIQVHNLTQTADMLSTRITIDASEKDSSTAAAAAVIDASNDDVATGDEIRIDVDVAGTGTQGLFVTLTFGAP